MSDYGNEEQIAGIQLRGKRKDGPLKLINCRWK